MIKLSKNLVILSPHIDDAIFSIGGLIYEWCDIKNILIINVFSKSNFAYGILGETDIVSEMRKSEDNLIMGKINVKIVNLDYNEALLRGCKLEEVFIDIDYCKSFSFSDDLRADIESHLLDNCTVLAPSAYGGHVDHVIVRDVVDAMDCNKCFYEDMPYVTRKKNNRVANIFLKNKCKYTVKTEMSSIEKHIDLALIYKSQIKEKYIFEFKDYISTNYKLWM